MKRCPSCEGARHYKLADGRFKCRVCGQRFSWTSVWDSVRLPAATKQRLLELFVLGVPSYRQRFRSDASAAARERFYRLLRACCAQVEQLREPFEGAIECDETTFGGARHGPRGWGALGKVIVFGLIKRNGRVKAMPIPRHDRLSVMREIEAHTREGALYYTDEWQAYATLKLRGEHVIFDSLDPFVPPGLMRMLRAVIDGLCALGLGWIGWLMWVKGSRMLEYGDKTQQLSLTLGWFVYLMSVLIFVAAAVHLLLMATPVAHHHAGVGEGGTP